MSAKKSFLILSLIVFITSICGPAMAATPAKIWEAIEKGIVWLAAQQNSAGYWQDGGNRAGPTGLALVKLQERAFELGYTPFDPCYPYHENVEKGLAYLFSQISVISITTQPHGNPDSDGDGNGVSVNASTYNTGIALMAIAASRAPDRVVNSPGSPVNGWTYKHVLVDMVDYMAFGQVDSGISGRGGWTYSAVNNGDGGADNSNSGYAVSGLGYAESPRYGFNCTIPQFVKDELKIWIDYIQIDGGSDDGGSGYTSPGSANILRTGNLIFQMKFVGKSTQDPNMQRALAYIGRKWNDLSRDPGWRGNPSYGVFPHCQAMYCTANGLQYSGINTIVVGGNERDWYADFADALVNAQQANGSWPIDPYGGNVLATEWALLILEQVTPAPCKLELTKVDDINDCVGPGREITYTICYRYHGDMNCPDINDVSIIDYLPDEVNYVPSDPCAFYDPGPPPTVTWYIGTLHPGDEGCVTLKVEVRPCVEQGSTITNCCEIKSGDEVRGIACEDTTVCCPTLTKVDDVNDCVSPDDYITYNICYAANGYGDTNVVIIDTLPPEVNFVSATGDYEHVAGNVTWNIGTLEPDESGCVELVVQVNTKAKPGRKIRNCCEMNGDCIHNITACEDTNVCCWRPTVIYVDVNAVGNNDGTSWQDAYNYLQDALAAARGSPCLTFPLLEIWVADGTYRPDQNSVYPNGTGERKATFKLINGVEIKGGYAGFGADDPNVRNPELYETFLSGDIGVIDSNIDNSYHVVTGSGTDETAVLDGFTITAGDANGPDWPDACGGGMYNASGSPTITDCNFSGNSAYGWGSFGGGIYNNSGSPIITNCIFTGNSATRYDHGESEVGGGGIYNNSGNPTITNCTFSRNSANGGNGGGMYNSSGSPTITNCIFRGNSAYAYYYNGYYYGGSAGGMYSSGSPTVRNCIFTGNSANSSGGGVYDSGTSTITNCTFTGNSAQDGGGYAGSATVTNCILWGNSGGQISGSDLVTYSDVEGGWSGKGNIEDDPCLASDGYHLTPCSPCIDAGSPCYVAGPDETDIDGEPRIMDGDCDSFLTIDMGADELYGPDREPNHIIVDDFEDYNNYSNKIQNTWKKGGGGKVGYSDPNYAEVTFTHGCGQSMPFDYNNTKTPYYYSEAYANTTGPNSLEIDPNWLKEGVKSLSLWLKGYQQYVGSFTRSGSDPNYYYTMTADGAGISVPNWRFPSKFRDEFHYAWIPVNSTDCTITAKVEGISCEGICCANSRARAGVMIRDSLNDDSKYALVSIYSGNGGLRFDGREVAGSVAPNYATMANLTPPYWLRLERYYYGYVYYNAYYSPTGGEYDWWSLGDIEMISLYMTGTDYIGLSLTARDACSTCTAVFSNVTVLVDGQPVTPSWMDQDIGIKSNTAAPLYVTLQDSSNNIAKVTHPDPNIALACTWQPWDIALSAFEVNNPNLDLTAIKKMTLGVGDGDPCGTGTLYFDDIRLYVPRCVLSKRSASFAKVDYAPAGCILSGDCVIDFRDFAVLANEWLDTVDFSDLGDLVYIWLEEQLWP